MVHIYDAQFREGESYVVECISDRDGHSTVHLPIHSKPMSYVEAKMFQQTRERQGFNAVIRMW